jgi:hypothetical protein
MEGIGIALDVPNDRMFITDLGGSVYSASSAAPRSVHSLRQNLSGVATAEPSGKLTVTDEADLSVAIIGRL